MPKTTPTNMRLSAALKKTMDRLAPQLGVRTRSDVVRIAVTRLAEEEDARVAKLKSDLARHGHKP